MATRKTREQLDAEMEQVAPIPQAEPALDPELDPDPAALEEVSEESPGEVFEEVVGEASEEVGEQASEEFGEEASDAEVPEEELEEVFTEEFGEDAAEASIEESAVPPEEAGASQAESDPDEDDGPAGPVDPALAARIKAAIESLLFAAAEPVSYQRLAAVIREFHPGFSGKALRGLLDALRDELREQGRGVRVAEVAGSYQLRTPSEAGPYVRKLVTTRPPRLTRATLETLAIVAYRQPITRPEVEEIRGVDCGAVLKHLLDRRLVKILGRKEEVGRPLLYATAPGFLEFFGLKDLKSLPTLKDFVELSDEHRAQLGLEKPDEAKPERAREERLITDDLLPEPTDAWAPVGQDEVIEELAEALDEVRQRDRQLRKAGVLPPDRPAAAATDETAEAPADGDEDLVSESAVSEPPDPETAPAPDPSEDEEDGF